MSPRGKENRRHERVSSRLTLQTVGAEHSTIELETDNLSLGGATCLSDREIPAMTTLRLNIFLPSSDGRPARLHFPIEVEAVVVRSERLNGAAPRPGVAGETAADLAADGAAGHASGNGHHGLGWRLALFFSRLQDPDRQVLARYLRGVADGS